MLAAATQRADFKAKVHALWAEISKDADTQVERIACWNIILADKELAEIVGNGDAAKGTAVLEAMKKVKALDQIKQDGRISEQEFYRLYDPTVLKVSSSAKKGLQTSLS